MTDVELVTRNINAFICNNVYSSDMTDKIIQFCQEYYDKPAHSLTEIKMQKNKKLKGDVFEIFCKKYFQHAFKIKFKNVWLLSEVPEEVLGNLKLDNHDLGIDIIAEDMNNKFYAIQAKYRKKQYKLKHGIPWKQLATFYGLVNKTGPWEKHIVITNADYVRHIGKKTFKDISVCYGTLKKIKQEEWIKMGEMQGSSINPEIIEEKEPEPEKPKRKKGNKLCEGRKNRLTMDQIREKRLEYFSKENFASSNGL
jgi:predicted helicase